MRLIRLFFVLVSLVLIGGMCWLFRSSLLESLGSILIVNDQPSAASAIVILCGESPNRALGALDLYAKKIAPVVLLTQEAISPAIKELARRGKNYPTSAELDRKMLLDFGLPDKSVVILQQPVDSTFSEAKAVLSYFENRHPARLVLVTSRYHSRRARATFRHILGPETEILSVPTPYDDFSPEDWWTRRANLRNFFLEMQKGVLYELYFLWNRFFG